MVHSALILLPLLSAVVHAKNDWSVPCFNGECEYDLPAADAASGTLRIWGSSDAITDITAAAGWTIIGCEKDALAQDIRLVCNSDDTAAAGCDHLYQNIGAVGKLVRLPESCGRGPFARISRAWVPEDQSIPQDIARRLVRRQGEIPEVKALALDTDFAAIDPAQAGDVGIAIVGSTVPGATGDLTVTPPTGSRRRSRHERRLFGFIKDAFKKFNNFDKSVTKDLPAINVDETFPIFEQSIACPANGAIPAFDASLKADVNGKVNAVITLGAAASGTIVPPKLDDFGVFAGLDADLSATLTLSGSASGTADSGKLTLFSVGIPGLDFPGILTIGPTFKIQGQATASLDIDADVTVGLSYSVNDAKLFFPREEGQKSGGAFAPADSPLKLSVSPSLASKGVIEAHVIPRIDMGISGLGGIAEATVFLDLDASAAVTLTLNAQAEIPIVGKRQTGSVSGCVDVGAGLDVNAGADGSFFGIFEKSAQVNLFTKKFELFKKCFGDAPAKRTLTISQGDRRRAAPMHKRALTCPTFAPGGLASVVDEAISGASIKAV